MQLIKTIKRGEYFGYGLFREGCGGPFVLKLPLFIWYGRSYQIATDDFVTGWQIKAMVARFGFCNIVVREVSREVTRLG